jgi:hypothetical protein
MPIFNNGTALGFRNFYRIICQFFFCYTESHGEAQSYTEELLCGSLCKLCVTLCKFINLSFKELFLVKPAHISAPGSQFNYYFITGC